MKYTRDDFWHGRRIKRCVINGVEIKDARVSDHALHPHRFYICQNKVGWGSHIVKNHFHYRYAYPIIGADDSDLEEIEFYDEPPRSIREVHVGDVVVDEDGDEKHVLARLGNILALSVLNMPHTAGNWYTFAELEGKGYRIKQEELQERETVVINGRKYNKQEVEDALKNLEEVE